MNTTLVQIGNRVFNPAQVVLIYLSGKAIHIEFAVRDGDQPTGTTFRGDDRLAFLAWLKEHSVVPSPLKVAGPPR